MISLVKTISTEITNAYRRVKCLVSGKSDVRESYEATPYGIDSNPIASMNAYYSNTTINGQTVVLGYSNKQQKAATGETRIFSTNASGVFKFNVWCRADGTALIGDSDIPAAYTENFMKYNAFNTVMQAYIITLNTAIDAGVSSAGGAYTPPTAPDFTTAKTDKIKTI